MIDGRCRSMHGRKSLDNGGGGGDFVKCKLNDPIISLIISLNSKFSCIYSYFPVPVHMFRITMRHLMSLGQTHDDGYL